MTVDISLSRVHFPVTTLGPGRRLGIWVQGCSIRCVGCISADTWGPGTGKVSVGKLLHQVQEWLYEADGVTISGGEPFDQPEALLELLTGLREMSCADILVYSGHSLERITPVLENATGLIDAVISDPFEQGQTQTMALRGSDNQRLSLLTALGRSRFASYQRIANANDLALDVMFDEDGSVWLAGIPRRDDFVRLRTLLQAQGHRVQTTVYSSTRDAKP